MHGKERDKCRSLTFLYLGTLNIDPQEKGERNYFCLDFAQGLEEDLTGQEEWTVLGASRPSPSSPWDAITFITSETGAKQHKA